MGEFTLTHYSAATANCQSRSKNARLTQTDMTLRLGVTQQTVSALERNAEALNAVHLMTVLSILWGQPVLRARLG